VHTRRSGTHLSSSSARRICLNEAEAGACSTSITRWQLPRVSHRPAPAPTHRHGCRRAASPGACLGYGCRVVRRRRPRVVLDSCNGAGSVVTQHLWKPLAARWLRFTATRRAFPHKPPSRSSSTWRPVREKCAKSMRTLGLRKTPTPDRVAIVDENGTFMARIIPSRSRRPPCCQRRPGRSWPTSLRSRMCDDVAKRYGCEVVRSKVGEVNVAETMMAVGAVIGRRGQRRRHRPAGTLWAG